MPESTVQPRYTRGRGLKSLLACFPSGQSVPISQGRLRSYPKLIDQAPATLPFYELAVKALAGAQHVLDIGCGSGQGTSVLAQSFSLVTGLDNDPAALAFAAQLSPQARYVQSDLRQAPVLPPAHGATIIDVLGHQDEPLELLRTVRGLLQECSPVLIAEGFAHPGQMLSAPQRQAFSPQQLTTLLELSGFRVTQWISSQGPFLCCVAEATDKSQFRPLQQAQKALLQGDAEAVLNAYALARTSSQPAVRLEALLGEADLRLRCSDGDGAAGAYLKAAELAPQDPRPLAGLAQLVAMTGAALDAAPLAQRALSLDPSNQAAASTYALVIEALGSAHARAAWRAASNLAPSHYMIVSQYARVCAEQGDVEQAIWALERLRTYGDEPSIEYHIQLASTYQQAGRTSDAQLEARLAKARHPSSPEIIELYQQLHAA